MLTDLRRLLSLFFLLPAAVVAVAHGAFPWDASAQDAPAGVFTKPDFDLWSEPPQASVLDAAEFASVAELEISRLDGTITPAQWKALHRRDKLTEPEGYDCKGLEEPVLLHSGAQSMRRAYFYPPQAPSTASIPKLSGQKLIDSSCTLAMIRVEIPTGDPKVGHALAEAVKKKFSTKYGKYETTGVQGFGSMYWSDFARWSAGNVKIISAYNTHAENPDPSAPGPRFFIYAQLPIVEILAREACCTLKDYHSRSGENHQFHEAAAMSGIDAPLRLRMDQLYEDVYSAYSAERPGEPLNKNWKSPLVTTLRDWLNALKTLLPNQRAAALFAADRLVAAVEDADAVELDLPEKSGLRSELQGLGAGFTTEYPRYTKNWLERARKLASEGAVGQMAVLAMISRGGCDRTGWDSEKVISEGEKLLVNGLDPPTELHVHFILGDAYADIVALAEGADPDIGDMIAKYRNESKVARAKALEHYRTAFSADSTSETARDAWLQAWRLSAGLIPETRYVCGDI